MKKFAIRLSLTLLWVMMALVLTVAATLICTVKVLSPDRLTPLVETFANSALDARVSLARAELSFRPAFPVLHLRLDSLTVLSDAFAGLSDAEREGLPAYADSLFSLDAFDGAIDLGLLRKGEIGLRNVELLRPAVNIVIARNGRGNFDIYHPNDTLPDGDEPLEIPPFSISHFAFKEAREMRFVDAADSIGITILHIGDARLDADNNPLYHLHLSGSVGNTALQQFIADKDIRFGMDGKVRWEPSRPTMLALESFTIMGGPVKAKVTSELAYDSILTIRSGNIAVDPISVTAVTDMLPSQLLHREHIAGLTTDAAIGADIKLLAPFSTATDSIPFADIDINMAPCSLRWQNVDLRRLALDVQIQLRGNDPDDACILLRNFEAAGPATQLQLSADVSHPVSDPAFDAELKADMDLTKLPPVLANMLDGTVAGRLVAELSAKGAASMFSAQGYHDLDVRGSLKGHKLFFLRADTSLMAQVDGLNIRFGSQVRTLRDSVQAAPQLAAGIAVDTANFLINGVSVAAGKLSLGAAMENVRPRDTATVVATGGALKVARLNIESITDSAGARIRDLEGHISLKQFKGMQREPLISGRFDVRRLSTGTPSTRFVISSGHIDVDMHRRPGTIRRREEVKKLTDSISRIHPHLSPDSVYTLALEKRRHNRRHVRRVGTEHTDEDTEMLSWDLTKGFRRFLTDWDLSGTISTRNARLFTPVFPLRNRVRRLNIAFNTDSVILNSVNYEAGASDMHITGIISNIRRSLTNSKINNTLKINLDITSDTIDVNQLSAATFAGAAYARRLSEGGEAMHLDSDDDSALDKSLDALASEKPDTVGALLIPSNIDARLNLSAGTVLYSDLALDSLRGQLLVYDGGVNMHQLSAQSSAGSIAMSALYSAPRPSDIHFGFGLDLKQFRVERFLRLVPAVDSIMPLLRDFSGIINADIAATVDIDSAMNMVLPTLDAAVRLSGDSLTIIDPDTYSTLGKWLRFRDKADNTIKHMNVELLVHDDRMEIFPFEFDIDRYRLGVAGYNDLNMNFNYHIAVLKSPLPFKFGITVSGNPDKYKVRFGGAKFKPGMAAESVNIVDTARVNLLSQIEGVFRRGVRNSRFARLEVNKKGLPTIDLDTPDTGLTHADSLALINEGLIAAP
ncbi:MAG: hypothetical protein K2M55_00995, partial [Muribaculaceae bacterium]|nr:hypothetical protein [Muribaculaceae bacterium]